MNMCTDLQAGKALHSKRAEIRVQFRHVPGNLYRGKIMGDLDSTTNELVSAAAVVHYNLREPSRCHLSLPPAPSEVHT